MKLLPWLVLALCLGGCADAAKDIGAMDYLSSHPSTSERMSLMCPGK